MWWSLNQPHLCLMTPASFRQSGQLKTLKCRIEVEYKACSALEICFKEEPAASARLLRLQSRTTATVIDSPPKQGDSLERQLILLLSMYL